MRRPNTTFSTGCRPFDGWPTRSNFDKFVRGFIGGETMKFAPVLHELEVSV